MTHNADPPFGSAKLLIARGKEHTDEFIARAGEFFKTGPCQAVFDKDSEPGYKLLKVKLMTPLPGMLRTVLSDAVNNLRHALDHAANDAAVQLRGGKPDTYFPMGKTAKDYADIYNGRRYRSFPADLRPYVDGLQPYIGGNDLLYALGRISSPNKHQVVLGAGVETSSIKLNAVSNVSGGYLSLAAPQWNRAKNEMVLAKVGLDTDFKYNYEIPFTVTIHNPATSRFEAAVGLLDKLAGVAESVVLGLEAETARLLRAKGQNAQATPPVAETG